MGQFQTAKHLCSWAGLCPGNNRSAGKSKNSRIKKGSKFLLAALVQASWGAVRKTDSILQRKFHRWRKKMGEKKANIASARNLLELVYVLLKEKRPFVEPDPHQLHEKEREKLIRHHSKCLRKLGASDELVQQVIASAETAAPSPQQTPADTLRVRRVAPAKIGALGFRARPQRTTEYSIINI